MSASRHSPLEVESLEDRTVLSTLHPLDPAGLQNAGLASLHHHEHHHTIRLHGQISGTWAVAPGNPDAGRTQVLSGEGALHGLGSVQADGTLHTPGFILNGQTTGVLTLTTNRGTLSLALASAPEDGFSTPSSVFEYTIVDGTGAFAGVRGKGLVTLQELPGQTPSSPPGTMHPMYVIAPAFTLTFHA